MTDPLSNEVLNQILKDGRCSTGQGKAMAQEIVERRKPQIVEHAVGSCDIVTQVKSGEAVPGSGEQRWFSTGKPVRVPYFKDGERGEWVTPLRPRPWHELSNIVTRTREALGQETIPISPPADPTRGVVSIRLAYVDGEFITSYRYEGADEWTECK